MNVIRPFEAADLPRIHALLTSNRWEFFLDPILTPEALAKKGADYFWSAESRTLLTEGEDGALHGFIRFFDIGKDGSADFSIRVDDAARGRGVGRKLLANGIAYLFAAFPRLTQIEAATRIDNLPMQKLFESVGFVKEAHFTKDWRDAATGEFVDSLGYAIARDAWEAAHAPHRSEDQRYAGGASSTPA